MGSRQHRDKSARPNLAVKASLATPSWIGRRRSTRLNRSATRFGPSFGSPSKLRLDVGGDSRGFNGDDLTSPIKLLRAGEVPDWAEHEVELRIHGVGGGAPQDLLEHPTWVQVGDDATAQFVRRTGGGRPAVARPLEGYWWAG